MSQSSHFLFWLRAATLAVRETVEHEEGNNIMLLSFLFFIAVNEVLSHDDEEM